MGGRGSGLRPSTTGASGGGSTPVTEASLRSLVTGNINEDAPKIASALEQAPVGTELTFNAYYSSAGQMQTVYEKVSADTWNSTWRVRGGTVYSTTQMSSRRAASDIFNDINERR